MSSSSSSAPPSAPPPAKKARTEPHCGARTKAGENKARKVPHGGARKSIGSNPIPDFLHIADYMISFMWQSCCGERAGSHINAVKTKGRTLLGDDTFNDAIWLTYNLPPLHLVDYGRFVRAWKKEGTQRMGIFKGAETGTADDPNSASQVVRRHLSATSPSPLYQ